MATPQEAESSTKLPRHIAVIMDGNNRWAKARGENGLSGHRAGAEAARRMVNLCADRGIEYLTLFVFSSENWSRPKREVNALMALFLKVLQRKEIQSLHERGLRICFIGSRQRFSAKLRKLMEEAEALTCKNTGMTVVVAADYGGRWDIANAARQIAWEVEQGKLQASDVDEETVRHFISLGEAPPPDICIRTGGEQRISNFLLWQFAYTELHFTDVFWPDFAETDLKRALDDYSRRQRRFGMVSEQISPQGQSRGGHAGGRG